MKSYYGIVYGIMGVRKTKNQRKCQLKSMVKCNATYPVHSFFGRTQKRGEKLHTPHFRQHVLYM